MRMKEYMQIRISVNLKLFFPNLKYYLLKCIYIYFTLYFCTTRNIFKKRNMCLKIDWYNIFNGITSEPISIEFMFARDWYVKSEFLSV